MSASLSATKYRLSQFFLTSPRFVMKPALSTVESFGGATSWYSYPSFACFSSFSARILSISAVLYPIANSFENVPITSWTVSFISCRFSSVRGFESAPPMA